MTLAARNAMDSRLGVLLVRMGVVPEHAIHRALLDQRDGDKRNIGDLLAASGELTTSDLEAALALQTQWREGDIVLAARDLLAVAHERAVLAARAVADAALA